jgi:DNA-binding transcriptional LysR family regulator
MDASWEDTRLFLAVAESGSLGKAAKRLGIAQPTVSRRLADLEGHHGFALFRRQAQGVVLTSRGARLLEPARRMAEWAAELARAAVDPKGGPKGIVRITAAPGVAFDFLAPFAGWLKSKHPDVSLEVLSSIGVLDLSRGEADLAIRPTSRAKGDLVQLGALEQEVAFFATPEYAAKLPPKYGYSDVDFVGWCPPYDVLPPNPQLAALLPGFSPVFTSDSFLVQMAAAEAGVGAIALSRSGHRFSRPSRLVPLTLDLGAARTSRTSLVASKGALQVPRVRLVGELLAKELAHASGLARRARPKPR